MRILNVGLDLNVEQTIVVAGDGSILMTVVKLVIKPSLYAFIAMGKNKNSLAQKSSFMKYSDRLHEILPFSFHHTYCHI